MTKSHPDGDLRFCAVGMRPLEGVDAGAAAIYGDQKRAGPKIDIPAPRIVALGHKAEIRHRRTIAMAECTGRGVVQHTLEGS